MRRQAVLGETFADTSPSADRPDPYLLPARFAAVLRGGATAKVVIDGDRVTIAAGGRTLALPLKHYRGVAVRMEAAAGDAGILSVILELNHADPRLSVTLAVADDPAGIVADWQAWARSLALPMYLVEADGTLTEPIPHVGAVTIARPAPRRRHSFFAARRPRFLVRRKTGWDRGAEKVSGDEIIARS
ncbi:MAG: hypothetical protein KIT43_15975 [Bauldia sp.]|nr:hypothetical protein [Bauldia sp.]MCW5717408.1 hypothetical protein [Bauldia sp.]